DNEVILYFAADHAKSRDEAEERPLRVSVCAEKAEARLKNDVDELASLRAEVDRLRAELAAAEHIIDDLRATETELGHAHAAAMARAEKAEKKIRDWIQETQDQHDQAQDRVALMRERAERAEAALKGMLPISQAQNDDLELPIVRAARTEIMTREEHDRLRAETDNLIKEIRAALATVAEPKL